MPNFYRLGGHSKDGQQIYLLYHVTKEEAHLHIPGEPARTIRKLSLKKDGPRAWMSVSYYKDGKDKKLDLYQNDGDMLNAWFGRNDYVFNIVSHQTRELVLIKK